MCTNEKRNEGNFLVTVCDTFTNKICDHFYRNHIECFGMWKKIVFKKLGLGIRHETILSDDWILKLYNITALKRLTNFFKFFSTWSRCVCILLIV